MQLETRNAELSDLAELLKEQHARKLDLVIPASKLRAHGGLLVVEGAEPIIDDDGVTPADGYYRPTNVCDSGIAEKLGIDGRYLSKLRAGRIDLYDANVNGWLHGSPITPQPVVDYLARELAELNPRDGIAADVVQLFGSADPDTRNFLFRTFRGDCGGEGIGRALLSDQFGIIDNLDVLTAALEGVRDAGVEVDIVGCDLTDRRMYVRVASPEVRALAPTLLANYRSPFDQGVERAGFGNIDRLREIAAREGKGYKPGTEPIVFAGFEIGNSEVGDGAFSLTPRLIFEACGNGLKITADMLRQVHLGSKMDEGVIRWSADTQRKQLELVTAKARDAVATFLDIDYVTMVLDRIEAKAATPIKGDAQQAVKTVCKTLKFSEERTASVLDHFIRGGQVTAGGVLNAVTSVAQTLDNADDAAEMEAVALRALDCAVKVA